MGKERTIRKTNKECKIQLGTSKKDEKDEEWRARSLAPRRKCSDMVQMGHRRSSLVLAS